MEEKNTDTPPLLNFQLDLLKSEIDQIQEIIGRIDGLTQQIKNWTVLTWAGSISLLIGNADTSLRSLIFVTSVIPFLFWIVDGHFRRRQRGFILRIEIISKFINSDDFAKSFKEGKISNFILLDLSAKRSGRETRKKFANLRKAMWFKSIRAFYLGLILTTAILQFILYPRKEVQPLTKTNSKIHSDTIKATPVIKAQPKDSLIHDK